MVTRKFLLIALATLSTSPLLAQMGMMETGKKLRIQRRTVTDMSEGSSVEFMVGLKSGGMLGIESDNVDHAAVLEFAEQFPIAELDDSL